MFSPFERLVAFRYLRARRREGFISVIAGFSLAGIALGVATLIIVMSVMNGFREELLNRILGVNGHLTILNVTGTITDYDLVVRRAQQIQGVRGAAPIVDGQVMATGVRSGGASGALVRGMRLEDLKGRALIAEKIVSGSLDALRGDDAVMVGARLAAKLGLAVGDRITLISPKGNVTAFGTVPRLRAYRIVATFEVGMFEYDSTFIFMPFDAAQRYFNAGGAATGIEVMVEEADRAPALGRVIAVTLGRDFQVYDWQRANASFFNAIKVERNVMFLILTLIIMVAAFNIISGLIMLVKDKGRDIAILRTMGATRGMVMRIFLLSGASLGVMGTVAGVVLGVAFADNIETMRQWLQSLTGTELFAAEIYFLSHLPARLYTEDVIAVVGMALFLAFLATIYPAWRAARLDPVEALRHE